MNTLIVAGSMVLVAIAGTIYFKYQEHQAGKRNAVHSE